MERGQYVGAYFLLEHCKDPLATFTWAVSLYALKKTFILKIGKDKLRKAIEEHKTRVKNAKLEYLKKVELMKQFTRNSLKNITKMFEIRKLNRHQMLYKEGDRADKVFFVIKGDLKVTKKIFVIDKKEEDNLS